MNDTQELLKKALTLMKEMYNFYNKESYEFAKQIVQLEQQISDIIKDTHNKVGIDANLSDKPCTTIRPKLDYDNVDFTL